MDDAFLRTGGKEDFFGEKCSFDKIRKCFSFYLADLKTILLDILLQKSVIKNKKNMQESIFSWLKKLERYSSIEIKSFNSKCPKMSSWLFLYKMWK